MGLMDVLYDLLLSFVEKYDAKRGIPRPVSHPDLTARQTALRCLTTAAQMFWLMLCGSIAAYLMWVSADLFDVECDTRFILICGSGVVLLFSTAKSLEALLPYGVLDLRLRMEIHWRYRSEQTSLWQIPA